jgi:hypothetical protein
MKNIIESKEKTDNLVLIIVWSIAAISVLMAVFSP